MRGQDPLIVVGAGGHAMSVADAALSSGWTLAGFYSPEDSGPASALGPVFSTLEMDVVVSHAFILGIGTNYAREIAFTRITDRFPSATFVTVVHKTAWVSAHALVHPGATILAHAAVGPGSIVGRGAILNTGASLDHESSLGNYASLGPGARTGGRVVVGDRTMIGMQASILQGISVGDDVVIGAHSLVNRDVIGNTVTWGVPGRTIRTRSRSDPYF